MLCTGTESLYHGTSRNIPEFSYFYLLLAKWYFTFHYSDYLAVEKEVLNVEWCSFSHARIIAPYLML